jgi:predicted nucleic acid-binding Zn ribbon protein
MPIYVYTCGSHIWECLRKVEDRNVYIQCEKCGKEGKLTIKGVARTPKLWEGNDE